MTRIRTILGFLLLAAVSLSAQVASDPIQDVEGVTFEQKLNAQVPMELAPLHFGHVFNGCSFMD